MKPGYLLRNRYRIEKALPVLPQPVGRKMFLKWLGFGGTGVFTAWVLSLLNNNQTSDIALAGADSSPNILSRGSEQKPQAPKLPPKLTVVQFASVKLDINGQIVDRPKGSAAVFTEKLGGGVGLTMVKIPAGKFVMGSPDSEQGRSRDEGPQRQVTIPEFYLGQNLVTKAQWQAITGENLAVSKNDGKLPVAKVSWSDAMEFCNKLSARVGRSYRLPSEAEWEYACRAGTTTPFTFGETITAAVVNYHGNYPYGNAAKGEYRQKATAVGSFPPNGFGLYDMHGNLWEWCLDEWVNSYNGAPTDGSARGDSKSRNGSKSRLLRGGAWDSIAVDCRTAYRYHVLASNRNDYIGLRVVISSSSNPSRQIA
jgi:eukaryotic-like serine/threonine-protein kinase